MFESAHGGHLDDVVPRSRDATDRAIGVASANRPIASQVAQLLEASHSSLPSLLRVRPYEACLETTRNSPQAIYTAESPQASVNDVIIFI